MNSIYVYGDKMVIFFNYKDSEKLVDFETAKEKTNPNLNNREGCQSSSLSRFGWAGRTRTYGMPESKSGALPTWLQPNKKMYGVDDGDRTHGLRCHKPTL